MKPQAWIPWLATAFIVSGITCRASAEQAPASSAAHYRVDAERSKLTAFVGVGGLLSALGHPHTVSIGGMSGDLEWTSFRITARADTATEIGEDFDEKDRQKINAAARGTALEAARYPDIVLTSTRVELSEKGAGLYEAQIHGDLTLHGVTRPIEVAVQVTLSGDTLRAQGEFTIRHGDYQIKRISAGGGTIKAKDEIRVSFAISARRIDGSP